MRYRYYKVGNKIICVSTFAGKKVRGVAICSPKDNFNEATGKNIARARCDVKVAEKRIKLAHQLANEAFDNMTKATDRLNKMEEYYSDAIERYEDAQNALTTMLEEY